MTSETKFGPAIAGALIAVGLTVPAHAQDTTTLKYATHMPPTHFQIANGDTVLMDRATALSDGAIEFEFYPAEQAGKALQLFDLVRNGVVDIADIATANISIDKVPLLGVWEMPGLVDTPCQGAAAIRALSTDDGLLAKDSFGPQGVRVLSVWSFPSYGPAVSRQPIESVEDMRGLKIRNAGGAMEFSMESLGAISVKMPSPEIFQSLQRSTLDAVMFSFLGAKQLDLQSIAEYGASGYSFGSPGVISIMSESKFQSLPPEQQKALVDAGLEAENNFCSFVEENEASALDALREEGLKVHIWTDEQKAQLDETLAGVSKQWADNLDARGKPGSEVLETFTNLLAEN